MTNSTDKINAIIAAHEADVRCLMDERHLLRGVISYEGRDAYSAESVRAMIAEAVGEKDVEIAELRTEITGLLNNTDALVEARIKELEGGGSDEPLTK